MTTPFVEILLNAVQEYEKMLAKRLQDLTPQDGNLFWYVRDQFLRTCKLEIYLHDIYRRNRGLSK